MEHLELTMTLPSCCGYRETEINPPFDSHPSTQKKKKKKRKTQL